MRKTLAAIGLIGVALFQPGQVAAQVSKLELGIDMGLERISPTDSDFDSEAVTLIGIPTQWVRFGVYLDEFISIEPRIGFSRISSEGVTETQARLPVVVLLHFQQDPGSPSFFLEGIGGVDFVRFSASGDSESDFQFRLGAGAGVLVPIQDALAFRGAGEYHRSFESDNVSGADRFILTAGFSFFVTQ